VNVLEVWKESFVADYDVSNFGRIRSWKIPGGCPERRSNPLLLKLQLNSNGYYRISCKVSNKRKRWYVHRLVALAYLPPVSGKPNINHKDGNKLNNTVDNLEWSNYSENIRHAYHIELRKRGVKLSEYQVYWIKHFDSEGFLHASIAAAFGVHHGTVGDIIRGTTWRNIK